MPNGSMMEEINNKLLREKLDYDVQVLQHEHSMLLCRLNEEQKKFYDTVLHAVDENIGGLFLYIVMVKQAKPICERLLL